MKNIVKEIKSGAAKRKAEEFWVDKNWIRRLHR